jgi:hypothetical protein
MGYLNIDNLYRAQDVLLFKEVYALEKIHGTSAHVAWKDGMIRFFAGGCKHDLFVSLFNKDDLFAKFTALGHAEVIVFGEQYGGNVSIRVFIISLKSAVSVCVSVASSAVWWATASTGAFSITGSSIPLKP